MLGKGGFRVGTFFGINIHLDWSWLLIFLLVSWNLTASFNQMHPDWGIALTIGVALAAAVLFFASVLAHELAHSLVARAQGVPVRRITLFLFGGVSNIEREPESPRAEFLITIVGPITSIVLGLLFILVTGVAGSELMGNLSNPEAAIGELGPVTTLLLWLGPINLVLGVFNLIPGFPLDGGRVLRSILWAVTDNLRQATRYASWVGQLIAWLMIGGGVSMVFGAQIPLFGTGVLNGLWLAFIGWFLHSASVQSYQQVVVNDILEDVQVSRMMRKNAPTVTPDINIDDFVHDHILGTDEHGFPVMDNNQMVGIVCLDDVRSVPRDKWAQTTVREIMTPKSAVVSVPSTENAARALELIRKEEIRQLPVVEGENLVGLLRRRDIVQWLQLQAESGVSSLS